MAGNMEIRSLSEAADVLREAEGSLEADKVEDAVNQVVMVAAWLAECVRRSHGFGEELPMSLAHYTSLEAVYSIIQKGEEARFRFADTLHTNDPEEGRSIGWAKKIAEKLDKSYKNKSNKSADPSWEGKMFASAYVLSFVGSGLRQKVKKKAEKVGDDLSFWRTYGKDGRGCSITFNHVRSWPPNVKSRIRRVRYVSRGNAKQGKYILDLLNLVVKIRKTFQDEESFQKSVGEGLDDIHECFSQRFLYKRASYQAENEYRVVIFPKEETSVNYEIRGGKLRHYLNLEGWGLRALARSDTKVLVGPAAPHAHDAAESLRRIWKQNQVDHPILFDYSEISYRPD